MAGELLAQVLLNIGNEYAARKAEERALARREQEKLDERAYQKALLEEQRQAQKEIIEFQNSKGMEQLKARLQVESENTRKNAALLEEDELARRAMDAGMTEDQAKASSRKEKTDAIDKVNLERKTRQLAAEADAKFGVEAKTGFGDNVAVYNRVMDAQDKYDAALNDLLNGNNSPEVQKVYSEVMRDLVEQKYGRQLGPGQKVDAEIIQADQTLAKAAIEQTRLILSSNPKTRAQVQHLELLANQLSAAQSFALQRGVDTSTAAEGQDWFKRGVSDGFKMPERKVATVKAPVTTEEPTKGLKLPGVEGNGTSDVETPKPDPQDDGLDPSNPFFSRVQEDKHRREQETAYSNFLPAYQTGSQTDEELEKEAEIGAQGFFGKVDPAKAAALYEQLKRKRDAARVLASENAGKLGGYAPKPYARRGLDTVTPGFTPASSYALGLTPVSSSAQVSPEEQMAWFANAQNWRVKP